MAIDVTGPLLHPERELLCDSHRGLLYQVDGSGCATGSRGEEVFMKQLLAKFGAPRMIHTDQGRILQSHLFAEMCKLLDIKKTRTSVYHSQSDSMIE